MNESGNQPPTDPHPTNPYSFRPRIFVVEFAIRINGTERIVKLPFAEASLERNESHDRIQLELDSTNVGRLQELVSGDLLNTITHLEERIVEMARECNCLGCRDDCDGQWCGPIVDSHCKRCREAVRLTKAAGMDGFLDAMAVKS